MRKFIIETGSLLVIFISCLVFLYYVERPRVLNRFLNIRGSFEVVNLGSSHGGAFVYDNVCVPGQGLNKSGNTLFYDLQHYKYYQDHFLDSMIVIIPVSYFSFGLHENRDPGDNSGTFVNDFYQYLPPEHIHNYSVQKARNVTVYRIRQNFFSLFSIESATPARNSEYDYDSKEHINFLKEYGTRRASQHTDESNNPEFLERNILYLTSLVEESRKNGHKPILVTTPFYKDYNTFDSTFLAKMYQKPLETVIQKLDVPFLDYSRDERFEQTPHYFLNSDHLNREGERYFSRIFFEDLADLGMIERERVFCKDSGSVSVLGFR